MLSDRDRAVLDIEGRLWHYAGAKEAAIREQLDMSAVRYYQVLNALLDNPSAVAYAPMVVSRLRRLRTR